MKIDARLAGALAVSMLSGCISYATHIEDRAGKRELAIATGLAAVEIGAGVLGGYGIEGGNGLGDEPASLGEGIMIMTGGIFMVDAIVALVLYASD